MKTAFLLMSYLVMSYNIPDAGPGQGAVGTQFQFVPHWWNPVEDGDMAEEVNFGWQTTPGVKF